MNKFLILSFLFLLAIPKVYAQTGDCPYPVIFLHGWISDDTFWEGTSKNADFNGVWGNYTETFHAVVNATDTHTRGALNIITSRNDDINGPDGMFDGNGTDDDVQWVFPNEDNILAPGCIYAMNFNNRIDGSGNVVNYPLLSSAPCSDCSDSNESAVYKQGYALSRMINAVLAANPTKDKVVLVGHSMGGLLSREYLQRTDASGNPQWWLDPSSADGHKVAKLVTCGTPHRGSNTGGNISNLRVSQNGQRNVLPDLRSEAVRDLRYSYETGTLGNDYPGVYLYGGKEADLPDYFPWYWSEDVNCDGDEDDDIIGINEAGTPFAWDGTKDNPSMPLPRNLRYTYYVSNVVGSGGDGVVDDQRQWIYSGGDGTSAFGYSNGTSIPEPNDGVDYRLADRVDGTLGTTHTDQTNDTDRVVQAMDEGDYPAFAWEIDMDWTYAGMPQENPQFTPADGNRAGGMDRDWYVFETTSSTNGITIRSTPNPDLSGRIDFYENPADYELNNAAVSLTFPAGTTSELVLKAVGCFQAGKYYVRITHDNVGSTDWKKAFTIRAETNNVDIVSTAGTYIATNETLDKDGWTHYWKDASAAPSTANDILLLSLQKDATAVITPAQVQVGMGTTSPIDLGTASYVPGGEIWHVMDRYWDVTPTTQPSSGVAVRFYYNAIEFDNLQAAVVADASAMASRADMIAYKFATGATVDPNPQNAHTLGTSANFMMMPHTDNLCRNHEYAEFTVSGFSGGGLGGSFQIPLPVELLGFRAITQKESIRLDWETASEDNFKEFVIEKSSDGISFEEIGEVRSSQNMNGSVYDFLDEKPYNGINYYRLKMLDLDNSFEYSPIVKANFNRAKSLEIISVSPVPFKEILNITMNTEKNTNITYHIYGLDGKLLVQDSREITEGENLISLNVNALPSGTFILNIISDTDNETIKIVK